MIDIRVPFSEKEDAKRLGARWDSSRKTWYIPEGVDASGFNRWLHAGKLAPDLVPQFCWYSNVRSCMSKEQWQALKKRVNASHGYRCVVCGGRGETHWVEAHEVWEYVEIDGENIQRLADIISVCPQCHEVKHMGHANTQGRGEIALAHMAQVNGTSVEQARIESDKAFEIWYERSRKTWGFDISLLKTKYGLEVTALNDKSDALYFKF